MSTKVKQQNEQSTVEASTETQTTVVDKIAKIIPPIAKLRETIKKRVHKETNQAVEDALVGAELTTRKDAVLKGLDKLDQFEKEGKKIKPDQSTFDGTTGNEEVKFSKSRWDEKKKNEKAIEDLTFALNEALDKGDYNKLNSIIGNKNQESTNKP